jgi:hypothetical protein
LEITLRPAGTVPRMVHVALSEGWSFIGIQVDVALGSSPMNAPSLVWTKPYGWPNTIGEPTIVCGTPP